MLFVADSLTYSWKQLVTAWPVTVLNTRSECAWRSFVDCRHMHVSQSPIYMPSRELSELSLTHLHFLSPAQRFRAEACVCFITCVRTELYEIDLFRFLLPSFFMDIVVNVDGTQCTSSLLQQGLETVVRCLWSGGLPSSCAVHMCLYHAIPNSSSSSGESMQL